MLSALDRSLELADKIEAFPLGRCGPSDDSDVVTAYVFGFRDIVRPFLMAAERIGDPELSKMLKEVDISSQYITEMYDAKARLSGVIDYLRELRSTPRFKQRAEINGYFIEPAALDPLKKLSGKKFDLSKLVRFCEELNDSYGQGNYLASALLIRAVINHVPPIFGKHNFDQVVASVPGKSLKEILGHLEEGSRRIADLHTHNPIRSREPLPSKAQIEPYRASFEILIHEITSEMSYIDDGKGSLAT